MRPIVIVGAGITGCVIARESAKIGHKVILIEREAGVGGLARTFRYWNSRDTSLNFVIEEIKDWKAFVASGDKEQDIKLFEKHARIGRPLGQEGFIEKLEKITGRILKPQKPGRKKK